MSKILSLMTIVSALALSGIVTTARADWDAKDVQKAVDKIKKGEAYGDVGKMGGAQLISFNAHHVDAIDGILINYIIDVRAKLCFARAISGTISGGGSSSPVPCKNIKQGYPLMAPIITWE